MSIRQAIREYIESTDAAMGAAKDALIAQEEMIAAQREVITALETMVDVYKRRAEFAEAQYAMVEKILSEGATQ